jgi:hypothetical protein
MVAFHTEQVFKYELNNSILKGSDDGVLYSIKPRFGLCPSSQVIKTTFRELALLPSSGKRGGPTVYSGVSHLLLYWGSWMGFRGSVWWIYFHFPLRSSV